MNAIAKLNYSHDAMVNLIIGNPGITGGQLAIAFGYTQGWVSQILASDAFQSRLAARREELVDPVLTASMEEMFRGVSRRSMVVLQEKLEKPNCPDGTVLKALELSTRALGYGAHEQVRPAAPIELEKLAENITMIFNQKRESIHHEKITFDATATNVG